MSPAFENILTEAFIKKFPQYEGVVITVYNNTCAKVFTIDCKYNEQTTQVNITHEAAYSALLQGRALDYILNPLIQALEEGKPPKSIEIIRRIKRKLNLDS